MPCLFFSPLRLELGEWDSARSPIIGSCGTQEQALLIDLTSSSCRRVSREEGSKEGTVLSDSAGCVEGRWSRRGNVEVQALAWKGVEHWRNLIEFAEFLTLRGLSLGIPLYYSGWRRERDMSLEDKTL